MSNVANIVQPAPAAANSKRGIIIQVIQKQMESCRSVLELGAGHFEMIGALQSRVRVGVEIFKPYVERRICDDLVIPLQADATTVGEMFPANSFDGVMLVDFIEHIQKEIALKVLEDAEKIARRVVLVHCPLGHHPQDKDAFGLGGDEFQTHRSEWEPVDFTQRGYGVAIMDGFFNPKDGCDPRAVVAVKRLA